MNGLVKKTADAPGFSYNGYTLSYNMMGRRIFYISMGGGRMKMHDIRHSWAHIDRSPQEIEEFIDAILKRPNSHCAHAVYEHWTGTYLLSPEGMISINKHDQLSFVWRGQSTKYPRGDGVWKQYDYAQATKIINKDQSARILTTNYLTNIIKGHPDFYVGPYTIYLRVYGIVDDLGRAIVGVRKNGYVSYTDMFTGDHVECSDLHTPAEYLRRLMLAIGTPLIHSKKRARYTGDKLAVAYPQLLFIDGRLVPHGGFYEHHGESVIYTFDDFCKQFG